MYRSTDPGSAPTMKQEFTPTLQVSNVTFSYQRRRVLSDITFTAEPGQCVVLAGPNGSGKSTLLSLIAGVMKPDAGFIRTDGLATGLVPQDNGIFPDMTVLENLTFFSHLAGREVQRPLPFGLEPYASLKAGKLSGGYQKRAGIAATACSQPDIWLFDEPCTSLDIVFRDEMAAMAARLKEEGKIVLYASHDPDEFLPFYDAILFLSRTCGQMIQKEEITPGTEKELIRQKIREASENA